MNSHFAPYNKENFYATYEKNQQADAGKNCLNTTKFLLICTLDTLVNVINPSVIHFRNKRSSMPTGIPFPKKFERTIWFSPRVKPFRAGVYERLTRRNLIFYSYWNGQFWGGLSASPLQAYAVKNHKSNWQAFYWRGLAENPIFRGALPAGITGN